MSTPVRSISTAHGVSPQRCCWSRSGSLFPDGSVGVLFVFLSMLSALVRYNVTLTLLAVAIALPISCACAFARLLSIGWVALSMRVYVNTLRSMPLVMVMFCVYMVVPMISGHALSAYWSALIALTCFEVAYFTEIVRAGVQSIASSQV